MYLVGDFLAWFMGFVLVVKVSISNWAHLNVVRISGTCVTKQKQNHNLKNSENIVQ
jgi:uncharacterized membrane protein